MIDQTSLARAGSLCWNPDCEDDPLRGSHSIRECGQTARGAQRSQWKTCKQNMATAAAMNIVRLMRWLDGEPHAQTRRSPLVQLLRLVA
jgi:hypothetical protein